VSVLTYLLLGACFLCTFASSVMLKRACKLHTSARISRKEASEQRENALKILQEAQEHFDKSRQFLKDAEKHMEVGWARGEHLNRFIVIEERQNHMIAGLSKYIRNKDGEPSAARLKNLLNNLTDMEAAVLFLENKCDKLTQERAVLKMQVDVLEQGHKTSGATATHTSLTLSNGSSWEGDEEWEKRG
jgi:hypothetical protein